jgi:hypothetical protein
LSHLQNSISNLFRIFHACGAVESESIAEFEHRSLYSYFKRLLHDTSS